MENEPAIKARAALLESVYPNLIVVGLFILLTLVGWWLGKNAVKPTSGLSQ